MFLNTSEGTQVELSFVMCSVAVSSSSSLLHSRLTHAVQYALILNSFAPIKVLLCGVRARVDVTSAHVLFTSVFYSSCRIRCTVCLERLRPHLNGSC